MDELAVKNKKFQTAASVTNGQNFRPRPSDVFIVTYPKCGTTWMSQILHSLRSNGDMDFEEITQVVPWDILALDCDQDINADQKFEPRLFKSHESYMDIAKDPLARYVLVCRNPTDAFVSFYKFLPTYMEVSLDKLSMLDFANGLLNGASSSGLICPFYLEWFKALKAHPKNVLCLFFEDLKNDLDSQVRKVNTFLGITDDEATIKLSVEQSTFAFMKENVDKFDDNFVFRKRKDAIGIGVGKERPPIAKVRSGKVGEIRKIDDKVKDIILKEWKDVIQDNLGFKDYEEFKQAVHALQQ